MQKLKERNLANVRRVNFKQKFWYRIPSLCLPHFPFISINTSCHLTLLRNCNNWKKYIYATPPAKKIRASNCSCLDVYLCFHMLMTLYSYLSKPHPLPTSLIYSNTKILIKIKDRWFAYETFNVVNT
jgi:hypothetical protein